MYEIEFELNLEDFSEFFENEDVETILLELDEMLDDTVEDTKIYTDAVPALQPVLYTSTYTLEPSHLQNLINTLHISLPINDNALPYISNIIYTKLFELLSQCDKLTTKTITVKHLIQILNTFHSKHKYIHVY